LISATLFPTALSTAARSKELTMQFNVSVQGRPYKTITAENTTAVIVAVSNDIKAGLVPDFNPAADQDIVITPAA
jgi:hypothetical protein